MICKSCGAEIKDTLKFCNKCGAKVEHEVVDQSSTIPAGSAIPLDSSIPKVMPETPQTSSNTYNVIMTATPPPKSNPSDTLTPPVQTASPTSKKPKSKIVAGILGIIMGCLGAQWFYLGRAGIGVAHLVIFFALNHFLPGLVDPYIYIGAIEGVFFLFAKKEWFDKFCQK